MHPSIGCNIWVGLIRVVIHIRGYNGEIKVQTSYQIRYGANRTTGFVSREVPVREDQNSGVITQLRLQTSSFQGQSRAIYVTKILYPLGISATFCPVP